MKRSHGTTAILLALLAVSGLQMWNRLLGQPTGLTANWTLAYGVKPYVTLNESDVERFNVTLWVRDWENQTSLANLNVTIFDLEKNMSSSSLPNATGHIDLFFLRAGSYVITAQSGNRTVGYDKINVVENATFTMKTWAYDVNMTLVDENGQPLANHTIIIHDQMVFEEPNYTIKADEVERNTTITVLTDQLGPSIARAETDENGTARFFGLWNGTYRLRIEGIESWVEKYVLGARILTHLDPAAGDHVMDMRESGNITLICTRVDMSLQLVSVSDVPVENATVYVRDERGHLFIVGYTNSTGFTEQKHLYVVNGTYLVSARFEDRVIGQRAINVTKTETFIIKCYGNSLIVTCIDLDKKPLPEHLVFLYDQVVFYSPTNITVFTNQTGRLVNWTMTDENGKAYFDNIWNGTYWVKVAGGGVVGEKILDIQRPVSIVLPCNKTYMLLRFVTYPGEPLTGATVTMSDSAGNVVFRTSTDGDGYVRHEGMYLGNYSVYVEWKRIQVWSGSIDIYRDRGKTIQCMAYRLTLSFQDPSGKILPGADVSVAKRISRFESPVIMNLETDQSGRISLLLPSGTYDVSCSYGILSAADVISLNGDFSKMIMCSIKALFWVSIISVSFPLVFFTLLLERRRLKTPLEIRKYRNMLWKLESMYRNGQVEYRVYRKLREEYEAKLMELGGREMR